MRSPPPGTRLTTARGLAVARIGLFALLGWWLLTSAVSAMPGFTRQTGQPCATCHVGTLGSPLGPFGRQVTLDNFAVNSTRSWPALNPMIVPVSFSLSGDARGGERSRAVTITPPGGDSTTGDTTWVRGTALPGGPRPLEVGPTWGFPYPLASLVAPRSSTQALTAVTTTQRSSGPGDTNLAFNLNAAAEAPAIAAEEPATGTPWIDGLSSHWHVALQRGLERHFLRIGSYGGSAEAPDSLAATAAGISYRFDIDSSTGGGNGSSVSAHATVIHDARWPGVAVTLPGNSGPHALDAFRADAAYSFADTVTPSIQYFRTQGTVGAVQYGWAGSRPNSAGVIAEVAYSPWARSTSPVQSLNLRFAAQYVAYTEYSSAAHGPGGNSAVYLSLWGALRF